MGATSAEISWKESVANNEHLANCLFELEMSKSKNTSFHNVYRSVNSIVQYNNVF